MATNLLFLHFFSLQVSLTHASCSFDRCLPDIPLPPLPAQLEVSVARTPEITYKHIILNCVNIKYNYFLSIKTYK